VLHRQAIEWVVYYYNLKFYIKIEQRAFPVHRKNFVRSTDIACVNKQWSPLLRLSVWQAENLNPSLLAGV